MYYLILVVFIIDRFCKLLVSINIEPGQSLPVLPFMNLTNLTNTGIAFSLFTGNNELLIWINAAIAVFLGAIIIFGKREPRIVFAAYALILGGALSNLWDRFFYNGVIDYLDFKVWPVFNVADSAISAGAVLLLISAFGDLIKIRKSRAGKGN